MSRVAVVAYDFSSLADRALEWATELARARGDSLLLVHALPIVTPALLGETAAPPIIPSDQDLASCEDRMRRACGERRAQADVCALIAASRVGEAIVYKADEVHADMIVMGTHGRGGVKRAILGSVADYVVRHAHCPVTTIREPRKKEKVGG